jgi:UDP-glucose 6-dehydrogenase
MYEDMTLNKPRIHRMSRVEAEITKIGLNCFLTTKISYANMIGDIVTKSGGNPDTVLSAIGDDTRIGDKYIKYGYGYGGPCFPRDNRVLALYAGDLGIDALISKASDNSNTSHLQFQIKQFSESNDRDKPVNLGRVTYKPASTMLVESQQLAFAVGIANEGFKVNIEERASVIENLKETYGDLFTYTVEGQ